MVTRIRAPIGPLSLVALSQKPISAEVSNIAETKLGRELIDLPVALGSRASGSTSAFSTLTTQPGVEIDNNGQISIVGSNVDMLSMSIDGISTMSPRNSAPITELFPSFDSVLRIFAAHDLWSCPLSAVRCHAIHVGLALLAFDRIFWATKQGEIDAARSDAIDAVLMSTLGAFDKNIHASQPF
jgi:hypothetical protein